MWSVVPLCSRGGPGVWIRFSWSFAVLFHQSATAFFLLTNFPFWLFQVNPDDYPPNLQGLVDCYAAAIPFWRNHMVGTLLYSALLFSPLGVAQLERGVRAARGATSALAAK